VGFLESAISFWPLVFSLPTLIPSAREFPQMFGGAFPCTSTRILFAGALLSASGRGENPDLAVGQNAVYVEKDELDFFRAGFGHCSGILAFGTGENLGRDVLGRIPANVNSRPGSLERI
jgi:hypothetical protein